MQSCALHPPSKEPLTRLGHFKRTSTVHTSHTDVHVCKVLQRCVPQKELEFKTKHHRPLSRESSYPSQRCRGNAHKRLDIKCSPRNVTHHGTLFSKSSNVERAILALEICSAAKNEEKKKKFAVPSTQ